MRKLTVALLALMMLTLSCVAKEPRVLAAAQYEQHTAHSTQFTVRSAARIVHNIGPATQSLRQAPPDRYAPATTVAAKPEAPSFYARAAAFKSEILSAPDSHPLINCGCTFTGEELDAMFLKGQVGYGGAYVRLQQQYGVCPVWSAAIDAAESGHFSHLSAPNNVSGFGFDGKQYMAFNSIEDCLEHKTRFLATHYLTPGGIYYKGTSLSAVGIHYNGSDYWRKLVIDVAYGMLVRGERAASK